MDILEIERKFLVKKLPDNLQRYKKQQISQAYVSTSPVVRIRRLDNKYYLTCKGKGEMVREEWEIEISKIEYHNLSKKIEGRVINKIRYLIPLESHTAELDVYCGNLVNLQTVEVEFSSEEEAMNFTKPDWFGEDVTYDNEYKNSSLCRL